MTTKRQVHNIHMKKLSLKRKAIYYKNQSEALEELKSSIREMEDRNLAIVRAKKCGLQMTVIAKEVNLSPTGVAWVIKQHLKAKS